MSVIDELLNRARDYTQGFDKGQLPMPPARQVAIVACMDARLNPYGLLGLNEGDAHVIRNAGGVITEDEIRSLTISQRLLGTPRDHARPLQHQLQRRLDNPIRNRRDPEAADLPGPTWLGDLAFPHR